MPVPAPTISVFVSSTWVDLKPEREALERVLRQFRETKFIGMEYFGSRGEDAATASVDEVEHCQLYVGIIGGRYGSGITEFEYRRARESGLHCLIYIKDEEAVAPEFKETDASKAARLRSLVAEMRRVHKVEPFRDSSALAVCAAADLHRWLFDEYLAPILQDAVNGEFPRPEAQNMLQAIRDLSALNRDLLEQLQQHRFLNPGASSGYGPAATLVFTGQQPQLFIGAYQRLRDAYLDPYRVFQRVKLDQFVGRRWLLEVVDAFLAVDKPGYFILEAAAGLGKTTFLAWLTRQRGYIHHFGEIEAGLEGVPAAIRSLNAQLISRYQLGDVETAGVLPPGAERPDFLLRMLRRASEKRKEGERIVIVVDALDEAGTPPGQNVLGLPSELPPGVCMVVSMRPVPVVLDIDRISTNKVVFQQLTAEGAENRRDMQEFLERSCSWSGVRRALSGSGYSAAQFVEALLDKCRGVWIYLHYVVHEIDKGERTPLDLGELPDGMMQYYARHWTQWRARDEDRWYRLYLPLLTTLAAAREGIGIDRLIEWSGVSASPDSLRRLLSERWRPFLSISGPQVNPEYRVYHATMREFFEGRVDREGLREIEWSFVDELARGTRAAHTRVADHFLKSWGGLEHGLPGLERFERDPAETVYGIRHLALHLEMASRDEDLHLLLRAANTNGDNLWFQARLSAGESAGFVSDVMRAWRLASEAPAPSVAQEIRYALIISSFNNVAGNMPPLLLGAMVRRKIATIADGLMYARQIPDPQQRAAAMLEMAQHVAEPRRTQIVDEVLALIGSSAFQRTYPDAMVWLVGRLALFNRVQEGFDFALGLERDGRSAALVEIIRACDKTGDAAGALRAARLIPSDVIRRFVLHAFASRWIESGAYGAAFEAVQALDVDMERAALLHRIIPSLGVAEIEKALPMARSMRVDEQRAWMLSTLAIRLAELDRRDLALPVVNSLRFLSRRLASGPAITYLAPALAAVGEIEEACEKALSCNAGETQGRILGLMCPQMGKQREIGVLLRALTAGEVLTDPADRLRALCTLAAWASPEDRRGLLQAAFALALTAPESLAIARLLPELAGWCTAPDCQDLLVSATLAAFNVSDAGARRAALDRWPALPSAVVDAVRQSDLLRPDGRWALLPFLQPAEQTAEALAVIDSSDQVELLDVAGNAIMVAPYLPRPLPAKSAVKVESLLRKLIDAGEQRQGSVVVLSESPTFDLFHWVDFLDRVVESLAQCLPEETFRAVVEHAYQKRETRTGLDAMSTIAGHAPTAVLTDVLNRVRKISDQEARLEAWAHFAGQISATRGAELVNRIRPKLKTVRNQAALIAAERATADFGEALIPLAEAVRDDQVLSRLARYCGARTLEGLLPRLSPGASDFSRVAPHLPPSLVPRVLQEIASMSRTEMGQSTLALVPLDPALEEVLKWPASYRKADALLALAPRVSSDRIDSIVSAAHDIEEDALRAELLAIAAEKASGAMRRALCQEVLALAANLRDEKKRTETLSRVAFLLGAAQAAWAIRQALAVLRLKKGDLPRDAMLLLSHHLPEADRDAIYRAVLEDSRGMRTRVERARALCKLAASMPPSLRCDITLEALRVAREVENELTRGELLADLAPHLPEELMVTVVLETTWMEEEPRAETFRRLVPYLSPSLLRMAAKSAAAIGTRQWRAQALSALAPRLAQLPRDELRAAWRELSSAFAQRSRADLLSDIGALVPAIMAQGAKEEADAIVDAIDDVGRWWP